MGKYSLVLTVFFFSPMSAAARMWAQNDYSWGSRSLKKDSISVFADISPSLAVGAGGTYYKNDSAYGKETFSVKTPLLFTARRFFLSLTPFYYPQKNGSSALGGKLYFLKPIGDDSDEGYTHFMLDFSFVRQKGYLKKAGINEKDSFSLFSAEAQIEKSYYDLFFFLASAAVFHNSDRIHSGNVLFPVFDYNDMAFLGTFAPVNEIPNSSFSVQFARNIGSDRTSYTYISGGRIKLNTSPDAYSAIIGVRSKLSGYSSMDFGYNWLKSDGKGTENYYKLYFQVFF